MKNDARIWGQATLRLLGPDGDLKFYEVKKNLITTAGDEYYAKQAIAGVDGNSAPTLAAGMKLGTGTEAVAKAGTGAAIETYLTGSNNAFDAESVEASAVGSDNGWKVRYTVTWGAGDVVDDAITEAAIVNDIANNSDGSSAANTYARVVFTAINKGANDTLVINWDHTFWDNPS